jgi:hypothetical protein
MNSHRRAILQLVAMGRVTAAEAERLLIASDHVQETLWTLIACIALVCLAPHYLREWLPHLHHIAHSLMSRSLISLHHAHSLSTRWFGGML